MDNGSSISICEFFGGISVIVFQILLLANSYKVLAADILPLSAQKVELQLRLCSGIWQLYWSILISSIVVCNFREIIWGKGLFPYRGTHFLGS